LPFTPVPINLATAAIFLAGALLGPTWARRARAFLFCWTCGPSRLRQIPKRLRRLFGPTGGFIIGYAAAAFIIGILLKGNCASFWKNAAAMAAGLLACYALGTLWFMAVTQRELLAALTACVFPFCRATRSKSPCALFWPAAFPPGRSNDRFFSKCPWL
jgi:biotin transport system substrate-specific component